MTLFSSIPLFFLFLFFFFFFSLFFPQNLLVFQCDYRFNAKKNTRKNCCNSMNAQLHENVIKNVVNYLVKSCASNNCSGKKEEEMKLYAIVKL